MANLTSKELTAIGDLLNSEQALVKKFNMYAQMSEDSAIKSQCKEIADKHQSHFDTLMNQLN